MQPIDPRLLECAHPDCHHPAWRQGFCAAHLPLPPSEHPRLPPRADLAPAFHASAASASKKPPPRGNPFVAFIRECRDDPVAFVTHVLGMQPLPWQRIVLNEIAKGTRRIAIRSGHGVGKSTCMAWVLIWFVLTRFPSKSVVTAPTSSQLFDALFSELKAQINRLPDHLQGLLDVTSDRVVLKAAPESAFISARTGTSDRPEAMAGIHSDHVLLIADEAPGIPESVYEAGSGSMSAAQAQTVLIGNPTRTSGYFFNCFHRNRDLWRTFHVSAEGNPLVDKRFVEEVAQTYGDTSNQYRVRVLGEFPLADDDTLIPISLVRGAMLREIVPNPYAPMVWGLDVARFGTDKSVLTRRRGPYVYPQTVWHKLDLMQLVGAVKAIWDATQIGPTDPTLLVHAYQHTQTPSRHAPKHPQKRPTLPTGERPVEIMVDAIGLGAGVADRLRELGLPVRSVNVAEVSAMNPEAYRLRDDLWMQCRQFLATAVAKLPEDEELQQDLCAPTFTFNSSGRLVVESKELMRRRGLASPDKADSLMLTFASTAATVTAAPGSLASWAKPITRFGRKEDPRW